MVPNNLELRHLRYFVAVAEAGSLSAAASRLHLSQPPLTRQIKQLEDLLGAQLFERQARGIALTGAGETLLVEAKNVLALVEQAAHRTQQADKGQLGRLDVGIFGSAIYGVIPSIIREFRNSHPCVEIELHNMERAAQIRALRERRIIAGFNRFFGDEPDLKWEKVHNEHMYLAVYNQHLLAQKKNVTIKQLNGESIVLYPRNPRPSFIDHLNRVFDAQRIQLKQVYEVDDVTTAIALVSAGMGVTIVTQSACNLRLPNIEYIPLKLSDISAFALDIIYRRNDTSPLLNEFLTTVRRHGNTPKVD